MSFRLITGDRNLIQKEISRVNKVHSIGYIHDNVFWALIPDTKPASKPLPVGQIDTKSLESVYLLYPRKIGKKAGLEALKKKIGDTMTLDQAKSAVINFTSHVSGRPQNYIPYFSTFVNNHIEDFVTGIYKPTDNFEFLNDK